MRADRIAMLWPLLAFAATRALACGYCVEDKMAAVYDHAVVVKATERKHRVAFFALTGAVAPGAESQRALQRIAESVRGVEAGTARASTETAALSFAFDPGRRSFGEITRALEGKLAARGTSAQLVTVLDKVAPLRPAAGQRTQAVVPSGSGR